MHIYAFEEIYLYADLFIALAVWLNIFTGTELYSR